MPTFQGNTIQLAIDKGLKQLDLSRDAVTVKVIAEGKKGFLGFGKKPAIVQLDKIEPELVEKTMVKQTETKPLVSAVAPNLEAELSTQAVDYLVKITKELGIATSVMVEQKKQQIIFHIKANKPALVIGRHGIVINALQEMVQTLFNYHGGRKWEVILDVGNYRERRQKALVHVAKRAAREVIASGQSVKLDPMPAFERKQVHQQLAQNDHIYTESAGQPPHRYVVVGLKKF